MTDGGFPGNLIAPLCIGCWVVPFLVIGVPYMLWRSAARAWQTRGVGDDGMYCARCKFDVRGNTGWECPECGQQLKLWIGPRAPRGGILVRGVDPPIASAISVLLYVIAGFVPVVIAVLMLGMLLPINYERGARISLEVQPSERNWNLPWVDFTLDAKAKRAWLGPDEFDRLESWQLPSNHLRRFNQADEVGRDEAGRVWDKLSENYPELQPGSRYQALREQFIYAVLGAFAFDVEAAVLARDLLVNRERELEIARDAEALREEFIDVLLAVCAFDRDAAESRADHFTVSWETWSSPGFHPLYTLFCFAVVGTAVVLLIRWALRDHARAQAKFEQRVEQVMNRYTVIVEQNNERMHQPP